MSDIVELPGAAARPSANGSRLVRATHGRKAIEPDPNYEVELSEELRRRYETTALEELYRQHSRGDGFFDRMVRRAALRAMIRELGPGLSLAANVAFRHLETFSIGAGVFIGEQAVLQGRCDGSCVIGTGTWIGPQTFIDARDLVIGTHVGIGPGVKILGSEHTGEPVDLPIIRTDLIIRPVRIDDWADIGTNATILPGVTLGTGCIVGAGAVVTRDVAPFAKVAGVPARLIGRRQRSWECSQ
jgi:acetyltransferase-like isoleucine patch superfamily enzyme